MSQITESNNQQSDVSAAVTDYFSKCSHKIMSMNLKISQTNEIINLFHEMLNVLSDGIKKFDGDLFEYARNKFIIMLWVAKFTSASVESCLSDAMFNWM